MDCTGCPNENPEEDDGGVLPNALNVIAGFGSTLSSGFPPNGFPAGFEGDPKANGEDVDAFCPKSVLVGAELPCPNKLDG